MTKPPVGRRNQILLWVVVIFGALATLCLLVGVAVKPSSSAYLVLIVPALVMVVGGTVLLRR